MKALLIGAAVTVIFWLAVDEFARQDTDVARRLRRRGWLR